MTAPTVEDLELGPGRPFYLVRPARPTGPAIIYLHWFDESPNANRGQYLDEAHRMAEQGVVSALPQLAFPWESPPTDIDADLARIEEEGRMIDQVYQRLVDEPDVDPDRVALVGHDFGAMHGTSLFGRRDLACAVLVAATPRWSDWFLPFWPIESNRHEYMKALDPVDPITRVSQARCPVLFQFAKSDYYIAPMTGAEFFTATPEPRSVSSYEADHAMDLPEIVDDRVAFLAGHLRLGG
ncbi:MAG TPA: hypothetical protein VFO17_06220 [Acidimicrobiia bacterium]|nr:hypothetical protein [Acidimicrobiia bacterium]